jgi:threonine dehydrogenase-like Zn-dependent dehydrogenase
MGAGPIGLLTLQCAILEGAGEVYISEIDPLRTELALRLGASAVFDPAQHNLAVELSDRTKGEGPGVVYLCTGSTAAFEEAVTLVGKGGQILVMGLGVEPIAADIFTLVLHELDIRGSYLGHKEFSTALEYIATGRVEVEALITHEIGLEEVNHGFELLETPDARAVKVMVKLRG